MLGLVNRALRSFLRDMQSDSLWQQVAGDCALGPEPFEALLPYEDALSYAILTAASERLNRPEAAILEDFGHWLVTSPTGLPLRRLLRFGGRSFTDFLWSLEELPDRARLAFPLIRLPDVRLSEGREATFVLRCAEPFAFTPILKGVIDVMADDYGALILSEAVPAASGGGEIRVQLHLDNFTTGQRFDLAGERL